MNVYQTAQFNSLDEFNAFSHGWSVDFRVATPYGYRVGLEQVASERLLISVAEFNQATLQQGVTPAGMRTLALPAFLAGPASWLNYELGPRSLMLFPASGDLFCVAGGALKMATVAIDEALFDDLAVDVLGDAAQELALARMSVLEQRRWRRLLGNLRLYIDCATRAEGAPYWHAWRDCMEEELVRSFITSLPGAQHARNVVAASAAAITARRAVDFILVHLREPFRIAALCEALGCSRRTLETSFQRCFGVSPSQFIRFQRLAHCRRDLLGASPENDTVTGIAQRWGFWHMGQLAADFKRVYRERPADVLARGIAATA